MSNYLVYHETSEHKFKILSSKSNKIEIVDKIPNDINKFYLTKGYEATDGDLKRYYDDIYKASQELKTSKLINFDYLSEFKKKDGSVLYRSHTMNIETIFKMLTKPELYNHEEIDDLESSWIEKTYNGGLMYCKSGVYDCFGYDFKMYYGSILANDDFLIPTKKGKQIYINDISDIKQFGYYMIHITSEDENIKKVFSFSEYSVYTHNDIKFVQDVLINKFNFKIKLELITNVEFNCYIYDKSCLISGCKIFKKWFETICKLKLEFPKNILIKMLSSSLWGHLSKYNAINKTEKQIEDENLILGMTNKADYIILEKITKSNNETYYKLLNSKKPYKYNIRLKSFITSYGRIKTAHVPLFDIKNLIRIHTDGLVFEKKQDFIIKDLFPEDKTTGVIEFNNINDYKKHF